MKNNKGTCSHSNRHRMHEKQDEPFVITEARNIGRSFWREMQAYRQTVDELQEENEELKKDKERLEWLVDNASISMLRKDEDGEEWWVELAYSEPREDIDKAMNQPTQ